MAVYTKISKDELNDFLKNYKFTIAAENSSFPGYTTEKIIHPLSVGSIPIYWGSTTVGEDFNEKAFINLNNFSSTKEAVELIKEIDNDDILYKEILNEPIFKKNEFPACAKPENVLYWLKDKAL